MVESTDNRTLAQSHSIAYGGVQGEFGFFWNPNASIDVEQTAHTHWYATQFAVPGVYRVWAHYNGEVKEILVQPSQNWQSSTQYYIDFEEPVPEPVADSCISVNCKVGGARVLIEVDHA